MPFMTTRAGVPLRKRRYFFSEAFAITAFAQVAKATNDEKLADRARALFRRCCQYMRGTDSHGPAKFFDVPERRASGLGPPVS